MMMATSCEAGYFVLFASFFVCLNNLVCVYVRACLCFNEQRSYIRTKSILLKGHN